MINLEPRGVEFNTYANLMNKTLRPSFGIMYLKAQLKDYPRYNNTLTNGNQVASPRVIAKAGIEWDTPFVGENVDNFSDDLRPGGMCVSSENIKE